MGDQIISRKRNNFGKKSSIAAAPNCKKIIVFTSTKMNYLVTTNTKINGGWEILMESADQK